MKKIFNQRNRKNNNAAADFTLAAAGISSAQTAYLKSLRRYKMSVYIFRFLILFGFLLLWEIASFTGLVDSFFFSSPSRVVTLFIDMSRDFEIWQHIRITLAETLLSFLIITVISTVSAILLISLPKTAEVLEPILVVLNALPKSALAPLIIVWLGTGMNTIIIAGISVALFGSVINMYTGFQQVEKEKIKLIRTLGGTKRDALRLVMLPASVPILISNMKVNIGLALVGVIIGEFLAAKQGLGYLIIYGSQVFQLDLLIMSILILCIIALVLYQSLQLIENRINGKSSRGKSSRS
ncbi:MAG: ABC transporter permease [Lachnospiraceae bacterium]|nr:ABC transporter permease [Lachnospiraceae bacterium]